VFGAIWINTTWYLSSHSRRRQGFHLR